MSLNDLKAACSTANIRALPHAAGYFTQDPNRDRDGDCVDLEIFSRDTYDTIRSPSLHLHLKATAARYLPFWA